jgi:type I restriction enzyme S subunit
MAMGNKGMGVWELPEGWGLTRLGELVEMKTGFACAKKNLVTEGLPHLRPFNVSTEGELNLTEVYHIPKDFKENADDYTLEPGHILFNNTNSVELVGKTAIVRQSMRCAYSNHITRLTVLDKSRLEPNWLALSLKQLWATGFFAANCNKWIGQAGFNTEMLAAVEVPLPYPNDPTRSLAEQRRIVARIEELFTCIEEARRLRTAADEDAERLMSAALEEVFEEAENKGWPIKTVGGLILGKPQYGTSQKASEEPAGIPILRMGNIVDGKVSFDGLKYIDLPPDEEAKYLLNEGDILFNRTNSAELVGKSAVYPGGRQAVFASYLIRIVADPEKALSHFVVAYINSPLGRQYIQSQLTRAIGQVNVNAQKLKALPLPMPPLSEQRRIVEYLDGMQAQVAELKRVQAESAAELERLEGAILARAFRGKL